MFYKQSFFFFVFFFLDGLVVSGKMDGSKLDVEVSEPEIKDKVVQQEPLRESDNSILDASSDSPRGLLINYRNICNL